MKRPKNALAEMGTYRNWELHKLAKTLLAWAVLIESLSVEHEKLAELEGFGMTSRDYSETVENICSSLDDLEIEAEETRRKSKKSKKAA